MRYLKLLLLFMRISIQNETAYRADFALRIVTAFLALLGELCGIWTIFANTRSIGGWTALQVVVLLGVFRVMAGLIGLIIAPNMRLTMERIRLGTLDFLLTRPVSAMFYTSFSTMVIWRGIDMLIGFGLVAAGCLGLASSLSWLTILRFVVTLAAGAVILYALWLAIATTAFWFTRINNIEMVFWNVFEAGRYPIDIYRPWVRWGLTYILPLAFLTTFPAAELTGRGTSGGVLAALLVAPLALLGATWFWRLGLRSYSGASA